MVETLYVDTFLFIVLCFLYVTKSHLVSTVVYKLLTVVLFVHLVWLLASTRLAPVKSTRELEELVLGDGLQEQEDDDDFELVPDTNVSDSVYEKSTLLNRHERTGLSSAHDFYSSIVDTSVDRPVPVVARSFSSYNPHHAYDD